LNKPARCALLWAIVLFAMGPIDAWAQYNAPSKYTYRHGEYDGKLHFGRIVVIPGIAFDGFYDSNVFKEADFHFVNGTSEGRSDDFIFVTSPSIHTVLERTAGDPFGFELNYLGRDERFVNLTNEDAFNHFIDGAIDLGGPGGRTDLKVGGLYKQTRESSGSEFDSNFNPRSKRFVKAGFADLLWRISELFQATANTRYEDETFDNDSLRGEENSAFDLGGSLFWQYSTPLAFGVRYNLRLVDYQDSSAGRSDSDTHTVLASVRWVPTSTISSELGIGIDDRSFDSFPSQDRTDFRFDLRADYHPTERRKFTLNAYRKIINSTFSDSFGNNVQSATATKAELGLEQKLGIKLASRVNAAWENIKYNEQAVDEVGVGNVLRNRRDNNALVDFSLIYFIQPWLHAKTTYHYQWRQSNFDDRDFTQHVISLGLSAVY